MHIRSMVGIDIYMARQLSVGHTVFRSNCGFKLPNGLDMPGHGIANNLRQTWCPLLQEA